MEVLVPMFNDPADIFNWPLRFKLSPVPLSCADPPAIHNLVPPRIGKSPPPVLRSRIGLVPWLVSLNVPLNRRSGLSVPPAEPEMVNLLILTSNMLDVSAETPVPLLTIRVSKSVVSAVVK